MKNKVNLFIVGAPKCGTTSLSEYLKCQDCIYVSIPKEPSYFCDDFPGLMFVETLEDYNKLFPLSDGKIKWFVDASPAYLISNKAIKNIVSYNRNAKYIVMIRNPIDMLVSYHRQLIFSLFEDLHNLQDAWDAQKDREVKSNIPKYCREVKLLGYSNIISIGDHLERLYDIVPQEQIYTIIFDDFVVDTMQVYNDLLKWLEIDNFHNINLQIENQAKRFRSKSINILRYSLKSYAKIGIKIFPRNVIMWAFKLNDCLKRLNASKINNKKAAFNFQENVSTVNQEISAEIQEKCMREVLKIESILGRDLSMWKNFK